MPHMVEMIVAVNAARVRSVTVESSGSVVGDAMILRDGCVPIREHSVACRGTVLAVSGDAFVTLRLSLLAAVDDVHLVATRCDGTTCSVPPDTMHKTTFASGRALCHHNNRLRLACTQQGEEIKRLRAQVAHLQATHEQPLSYLTYAGAERFSGAVDEAGACGCA